MHIDAVPVGEKFIEFGFSKHTAQDGLAGLAGGIQIIFDVNDGFHGLHDAKKHHGVYFDRTIILGDDVLRRHDHGDGTKAHFNDLIDYRQNKDDPGSLRSASTPQAEDDSSFIFIKNADALGQDKKAEGDYDTNHNVTHFFSFLKN